jgi:hypothetical protein
MSIQAMEKGITISQLDGCFKINFNSFGTWFWRKGLHMFCDVGFP